MQCIQDNINYFVMHEENNRCFILLGLCKSLVRIPLSLFFFSFYVAPSPPNSVSFTDVANTSLSITWLGPPDWTDYDDFELQWFPKDPLTVFNPYSSSKSKVRIIYGLRPGRLYEFSVRTVSGDSWKTYSQAQAASVRTSK